jgi:methylmalonyl-CoA carboxyltransferase 1.3S subunit
VKLKITINEKTYEVDVEAAEPETPAAAPRGYSVEPSQVRVPAAPAPAPPGAPSGTAPVNEEKVCRSPVSGIVVKVVAQPGQTLQVGDILLVLEAMKMETNITAPVAGKVAAIKVAPGESVASGQIVAEFAS